MSTSENRDLHSLRREYDLYVEWEVESYKARISRSQLLEIGDIAVGRVKQQEHSVIGYDEQAVWQEVDKIVRKKRRLPRFEQWLQRRSQLLDSGAIWGDVSGTELILELDASALLGAKEDPSFRHKLVVVNDQLLDLVARKPDLLHAVSSRRFEELVAELLMAEGFLVELTPASRDGGRDILVKSTSILGNSLILVECKKYSLDRPVGVGVVRSLYGTVLHERANAGVLVTTSTFTRGAQEFQRSVPYQLTLKDYLDIGDWVTQGLRRK